MSVCLVLFMLIADQKNNDAYITNKDRIYRITYNHLNNNSSFSQYATAPLPMAEKLMSEYSDLKHAVRIRKGFGNNFVKFDQDLNIPVAGFFVDPEFLELFQYELLSGKADEALVKPKSVVLKEEAAIRLFGTTEVIGNVIEVGDQGEYIITGVIKDNNEQSHIKFDALASLASLKKLEEQDSVLYSSVNNWQNRWHGYIYVELADNVDKATLLDHIEAINVEQYSDLEDYQLSFDLQALNEISPGPLMSNEIGPGLPLIFVYFMGGLAILVMLSAAFNYMNLSIARALTRAREVGVRKVSGATKTDLIMQFLTEAILLSLFALLCSYGLLVFLKPAFSQLHFSEMLQWNLRIDQEVILISIVFSIVVGILAGIIPAITLSSLKPSQVLKQLSGIKLFSKIGLRKALIVSQFSLSLIFIISTTLVYNQLQLMLGADFGFQTDGITNIRLNETSYTQLKTELEKYPQIETISASSHIPASGESKGITVKLNLEDELERQINLFYVDENYINTLQLEVITGSNFRSLDPAAHEIIVNEECVADFKLGSPHEALGKYLINTDDSTEFQIVGVVKDYYHKMLVMDQGPMMLIYEPDQFRIAHVATVNNSDVNSIIDEAYEKVNPGYLIDRKSMNEELAFYYDFLFGDLSKITALATFLALVIACLGLLGIATYTIETKTKEVGIRKVLGATEKQLIVYLSKSFVYILLISIVIAVPLAYLLNDLWLQQIAYRVDITPGVVLFSVTLLTILGILTIGSQTFRASTVNPVDSLRNE